jgi:tripartite-type tricarboxylate transporter receptor subunit TctC
VTGAKVPQPQALLHDAAAHALRGLDLIKAYCEQGTQSAGNSPAEFRDFIVVGSQRWGDLGRRAIVRMG